jgi:hypothetical protein
MRKSSGKQEIIQATVTRDLEEGKISGPLYSNIWELQ